MTSHSDGSSALCRFVASMPITAPPTAAAHVSTRYGAAVASEPRSDWARKSVRRTQQEDEHAGRDDGAGHARVAPDVPHDRGGEHEDRGHPRAALAAPHAPREHDQRDPGEREQGGGRLADADGQHAQDGVQPGAQRRRDGHRDVGDAREDDRQRAHAAHEALAALASRARRRPRARTARAARRRRARRAAGRRRPRGGPLTPCARGTSRRAAPRRRRPGGRGPPSPPRARGTPPCASRGTPRAAPHVPEARGRPRTSRPGRRRTHRTRGPAPRASSRRPRSPSPRARGGRARGRGPAPPRCVRASRGSRSSAAGPGPSAGSAAPTAPRRRRRRRPRRATMTTRVIASLVVQGMCTTRWTTWCGDPRAHLALLEPRDDEAQVRGEHGDERDERRDPQHAAQPPVAEARGEEPRGGGRVLELLLADHPLRGGRVDGHEVRPRGLDDDRRVPDAVEQVELDGRDDLEAEAREALARGDLGELGVAPPGEHAGRGVPPRAQKARIASRSRSCASRAVWTRRATSVVALGSTRLPAITSTPGPCQASSSVASAALVDAEASVICAGSSRSETTSARAPRGIRDERGRRNSRPATPHPESPTQACEPRAARGSSSTPR